MTPPMTPREKVRQIIDDALNSAIPEPWEVAYHATDRILTALASGSGDHAELARLAEEASSGPWSVDADEIGRTIVASPVEIIARDTRHNSAFIAAANPAAVLALLAENAALRAARDDASASCTAWSRTVGEMASIGEGWKERCVEAERKLAEAERLNDRAADLMRQCTDPERFVGASTLNVYANMRAWLSDLSKEAERG